MPRGRPKKSVTIEEPDMSHSGPMPKNKDPIMLPDRKEEVPLANEAREDEIEIPLSDGANLVDEEDLISVDEMKRQEEEKLHFAYLQEQQRLAQQQEARDLERNAKKQAKNNLAHHIGKSIADRTTAKVVNDGVQRGKHQEKLAKTYMNSNLYEEEYIQDCIIMNGYRTRYDGVIEFPFKKIYEPGTTPPALVKAHLSEVRMILNGNTIPYFLTLVLEKGSEFISKTSVAINIPWLNFSTFHQNIQAAMQAGFFQSEIDQLSVELLPLMSTSPFKRFLAKLAMVGANTWMENAPKLMHEKTKENMAKVDPKKVEALSNKYNVI